MVLLNQPWVKILPNKLVLTAAPMSLLKPLRRFFPKTQLEYSYHTSLLLKNSALGAKFFAAPDSPWCVWGGHTAAKKVQHLSKERNQELMTLAEGFLSYNETVKTEVDFCSLLIDDLGVYYDATRPSRLEDLLNTYDMEYHELSQFSCLKTAITAYRSLMFDRYMEGLTDEYSMARRLQESSWVLVVDQYRDAVESTIADAQHFKKMLRVAQHEYPKHNILVKVPPDAVLGKRPSYLFPVKRHLPGVYYLTEPMNDFDLLGYVNKVYTVSSHLGFDALLMDKPVVCFGLPFYSGWGLTHDYLVCQRRQRNRTLDELLYICYRVFPRYVHPETHKTCDISDILPMITGYR